MSKRLVGILLLLVGCLTTHAGVTTYVFTNPSWGSKVGATVMDGKTDGWVCDKAAYEYMTGRTDAEGRLYSQGVSVKTSTDNAGATSVLSFTEVRQLSFNFCLNASKGRGVIYVQVGTAEVDSIVIARPATSGSGIYMRDSVLRLATPESGHIRFWVHCTENAININSITVRAQEGGSNPFTTASYQLVTSETQLRDSDQIIIGVHQAGANYVMGYFDESVSQNNIHAIRARYDADRTTVEESEESVYTLRRAVSTQGEPAWYIQDEWRYEQAFLVASGGQTKNRLALWDHLYDAQTYGDYGYWTISIRDDGEAVIKNLGNSAAKYLQYNAVNNPTLFACYKEQSQTAVAIYRRVEAIGDEPGIVAPLVNFGEQLMDDGSPVTGSRTILINANRLAEDIEVSLARGEVFSLASSVVDREGDYLTVSFRAAQPGRYVDTILFRSNTIMEKAVVMLRVIEPQPIEEVVVEEDFTTVYLDDVVVTKKYDSYIFVRDATASMLIYDTGDGTGHRYGTGLKSGDVLRGVTGKVRNYFGVPELAPSAAWKVVTTGSVEPDVVTQVDSADVCRYIRLEDVEIDADGLCSIAGKRIRCVDAFNTGIIYSVPTTLDAIAFISWDELQLWIVRQSTGAMAIDEVADSSGLSPCYNILGQRVSPDYRGIVIENQKKRLQ